MANIHQQQRIHLDEAGYAFFTTIINHHRGIHHARYEFDTLLRVDVRGLVRTLAYCAFTSVLYPHGTSTRYIHTHLTTGTVY